VVIGCVVIGCVVIGAVDVQQSPFGSVELQGVSTGFRDAVRELAAARQVVADLGVEQLGTRAADPAVEAGVRDLAQLLQTLEATAAACVVALSRYGERGQP
jgi:hypothetical protein